jgi:hypothetical protein
MKKILFLFSLAALLFSCKKLLTEEPLGLVTGNNAVNSVEGLQAVLSGAYRPLQNNFGSGFTWSAMQAVGMGGDDLTTHPASNKAEFRQFDQFNVSDLNSRMTAVWNGSYKSIQGSNNIITNYKLAPQGPKVDQVLGEAYFLRAFNYYWLVRLWGDIPVITSPDYTAELKQITKSKPADVYKLIESDLTQAIAFLAPAKTDPGRSSKGAAKALLADVYLTESGWPLKDASKLPLAASLAKEVIDNKATYNFDLATYATLWTNTVQNTPTKEEVFALQCCGNCSWSNGNSMYGQSPQPGDEGGWDDYFPEIKFYNNFPDGARKDAYFYTNFKNNTIPWQNSITKHPYYKKFMVPGQWFTSQSLMLMRYAHVLLIYAEAKARTGGPDQAAYDAINAIRTRAGLAPLNGLSNADFINAVIDERGWEFAGEGTARWFDLIRLEKVASANSNKDPRELPLLGAVKIYLPIPATEVALNPYLK